jgi:hypothetical protein
MITTAPTRSHIVTGRRETSEPEMGRPPISKTGASDERRAGEARPASGKRGE